MTIFAAYDLEGAPLAGLAPTWHAVYDAATELPIASPTIANLGDGLYLITGLTGATAGIIDLGATASPRYLHLDATTLATTAAFDLAPEPLAGLAPAWDSFVDGAGAPAVQPTITELGGGLYKIDYSGPDDRSGVIDFGATAAPRYPSWVYSSADTDPPTIANMAPVPGEIVASDVLEFDVEDTDPGLRTVILTIKFASQPSTIVVHDGAEFKYPFTGAANVRTSITDGYHYAIRPSGGWLADFSLDVAAVDRSGNLV